jgi:CheY-like chemotaxis protein
MTALLELLGYEVESRDGRDYYPYLNGGVDCIVCSHQLYTTNGSSIYQQVRSTPQMSGTSFLVLTGDSEDIREEYEGLPQENILLKPFFLDELEQRIEQLTQIGVSA